MTSTLSAQGQLLAGVTAALKNPTTGVLSALAATDPLRYEWPAEDLVGRVRDGSLSLFPFIVLSLGKEQPDAQGGITAYGGAGNATGPTAQDNTATQLIETAKWQCPLTLMLVAGGQDGLQIVDRIKTLTKLALRAASPGRQSGQNVATAQLIIPLPDDLETAGTVPGPHYGLKARLDDLGSLPVMNDAPRLLYRIDLSYRAHYSEYRQEVVTMAQNVHVTYESGIFQPITITPS